MLFMCSYSSLAADYILDHERFGDTLIADGLFDAYQRYRTLLSILVLEQPDKQLVLKSPEHLWFLPALLQTFPDARVIWTHRDPARALPSYSAQISLPVRQHRGRVDPLAIGRRVLSRFEQGVSLGEQACDAHPDAKIVHVRYPDLVRDPVEAVRSTYEQLELEPTAEHLQAMRTFLRRPQKDRHRHSYSAEAFGFSEPMVRERFAHYMERFQLEPER